MTPNLDKLTSTFQSSEYPIAVQWSGINQTILGKYDANKKCFYRMDGGREIPKYVLEKLNVKVAEKKYLDIFIKTGRFYFENK